MSKRKSVDLERLRAAYQASGISWHQLGRAAKVSHPTLSRLNSRDIKAVNPATLSRIAAALRVPETWLTGEQKHLPHIPQWDLATPKGRGLSLWDRPTADAVRYSWFIQRIEATVHRDLNEWYGEREERNAFDSWGRGLLGVFSELSSSLAWRLACLETVSGNRHILPTDRSPSFAWLEHLLAPWFAGRAYLNADFWRQVLNVLHASPGRTWKSEILDKDELRALKEYAKKCGAAVAKRLEAGYEPEADYEGEGNASKRKVKDRLERGRRRGGTVGRAGGRAPGRAVGGRGSPSDRGSMGLRGSRRTDQNKNRG